MENRLVIMFSFLMFFSMMVGFQIPDAIAADLSEGTYVVEFEVLQAESDSVSIANDYFEKPATMTIDKDGQYVQFTVNHSKWIKVLKTTSGESFVDLHVVSEDFENDKRVVAFKVDGDITAPLLMQMHVLIEEMEPKYDHKYTVRLDLDLEKIEMTDAPRVAINTLESVSIADESNKKIDEPTSDKALIYVLLAVIAIVSAIFVRKFSSSKRTKK